MAANLHKHKSGLWVLYSYLPLSTLFCDITQFPCLFEFGILDIQEFITPTFYGLCDFSMLIFPSSGVHL